MNVIVGKVSPNIISNGGDGSSGGAGMGGDGDIPWYSR